MSDRWPEKVIVGLTGNIATGKTTVLQLAVERGALALDADAIVHEILAGDHGAQNAVVEAFGPEVRQADGAIDRAAVAAIVFNDERALRRLEGILHPRVRRRLIAAIDSSEQKVVFVEAIKLIEGGLAADCDQIWVTRCPAPVQVQRLMAYRGLDEATALMRVSAQSSQEAKAAVADVVIDTGGTLAETRVYFEIAWDRLQRRPAGGMPKARQADSSDVEIPDTEPADDVAENVEPAHPAGFRDYEPFGEGITVRRAQPGDIPAIIELVRQASQDSLILDRDQLLSELGRRGYVIGQQGDEISAVAGWSADNLVATIDCFFVHPARAFPVTGAALLYEIELTANELTCEVILALPDDDWPAEIGHLLADKGFSRVVPESLPRVWQAAVAEASPPASIVMLKILRDTRQAHVRKVKESKRTGAGP